MKPFKSSWWSWQRVWAMIIKETFQMRRDRLTFAMMIGIPVIQLILFGFAINSNPRHLPTAVLVNDQSPITRSIIAGFKNTDYFNIKQTVHTEKEAETVLRRGEVLFVISTATDFTKKLIRGNQPQILLETDATDPVAVGQSLASVSNMMQQVLAAQLSGPIQQIQQVNPASTVVIHAKYNPENITAYNIVPGLVGVVLTMTMILITGLAITRERERGTMENLLVTPIQPAEVMIGKIVPYIFVGFIQASIILLTGHFLFHVPIEGSITLLVISIFIFMTANLMLGLLFSSLASNQLQAMQMNFFFFLPSILLSGFMFPFLGMPPWAQAIGQVLPLTHFLRIVRGIMLKGAGFSDILPQLWPIVLFMLAGLFLATRLYRRTLD